MPILGIIASSKKASPPVSGYTLWLDAADASVFTYSSGTIVSQWTDKSGNNYNFTQATLSFQLTDKTASKTGCHRLCSTPTF